MMRDFTKEDWMMYSGAEKFSEGSEPMIGEYGPVTIIADKFGVTVLLENQMFELDGIDEERGYKKDVAERILKEVKEKTPREIEYFMRSLGFETIM